MIAPVQRLSTTLLLDGRAAALPVLLALHAALLVGWHQGAGGLPDQLWILAPRVQCSAAVLFLFREGLRSIIVCNPRLCGKTRGPGPRSVRRPLFVIWTAKKKQRYMSLIPRIMYLCHAKPVGPGVPWCDNIYHTCINTSGAKRVLEYHHLIIQHSVSVAISKVWLLHIDLISQLIEADFVRCPSLKMSINRDRYSKDPLLELN